MNAKEDVQKMPWGANMPLLRLAAIVLPVLFLIGFDVLRHTVFPEQLHSPAGYIGLYGFVVVAVIVFAYTMFNFIDRLQSRVVRQNRQLSALNDIAKASAAKLRLEELLETSLDLILSNMRVDAGLICLVDLERREHSAVCYRGFSQELVRKIQHAKLEDTPIARKVVITGQPVIWEHIFEDPQVAERTRQEGMRSGITAPLKSEGQVNGLLAIASRTERDFSPTDREFLEGIGGQLGMAITNASLYEQSLLQNKELSALLAVGKVVTSSFDMDELLQASLDTIIEVTSADAAEAWLMEGNEELAMRCHRGAHREAFLERIRFRVGEGIPGMVAERHETMVVGDLSSNPLFLRQGVVQAGFHTFCALPLRYQSKLLGVLAVAAYPKDAINGPRDVRLLEGIGEWLALSIENIRLYQQVQDLAVVQERERIAREMHDGMAQLLGYINTQTIAVKKFLADGHTAEARTQLTAMEEIARDLYADVREGILGLRLAADRGKGMLPVLEEYTQRYMEMSGIDVEIQVKAEAQHIQLSPSVEIQLIRVVQEALTNVRKHSRATRVEVALKRHGNELEVTVADNGQGFEPANLPSTGWPRFGLQTMKERAEAVGGTLTISTTRGQGTRVIVRIPLPQQQHTNGTTP